MKKVMLAVATALVLTVSMSSCSKSPEEKYLSLAREAAELVEKIQENPLSALSEGEKLGKLMEEAAKIDESTLNFTPEQQAELDELERRISSLNF